LNKLSREWMIKNTVLSVFVLSLIGCTPKKVGGDSTVRRLSTFDQLIRVEFILDYPVKLVWPHIVDRRAWIKTFQIETVAGVRGEEGEVIRISVMSGKEVVDEYFSKTVKVIPNKQVIMKYLPHLKHIGAIYILRGYDVYELQEINGKTHVTFQTFQEYSASQIPEEDLRSSMESAAELGKKMWFEGYIPELKKLLQKSINSGALTHVDLPGKLFVFNIDKMPTKIALSP